MTRAALFLCVLLASSLLATSALAMISREYILRVVRAHLPEIRACYEDGLRSHPDLAGRVVIRFSILGDGTVPSADVTASTLSDPAVGQCIAARVRTFVFPPIDRVGGIQVNYPFIFEAPSASN